MTKREFRITGASRGTAITVKIIPRASRAEIAGIEPDGTLKVRLVSPPIEGQLDAELIAFLAEFLAVSPHDIEIVAGHNTRNKLISILHIDVTEVERRVQEAVGGPG